MAFTTDEITAAVEQLVRSSIRRPYDDTGVRRSDVTFSDMNDAAAGVFVLYPNALYYVAKLCTDKLAKTVEVNQNLLVQFMGYVSAVARHVSPITSLSALMNARVALQELASSSPTRESGMKAITETSAYSRFDSNTQRFLDEAGGAVVQNGDVVPTPDEARSQFSATLSDVKDGFVDVVSRAMLLADAVTDFDSMNLPATLFANIVNNAQELIGSEYDSLSKMTPDERLAVIRTTVLNVLATRSTIKGFGSMSSPGMFYELSGMGAVYSDANYPTTHASLTGDLYGPFNILGTANQLDLRLDGDTAITTTLSVQPAFIPFIEGMAKEPYAVDIGTPTNRFFRLGLRSYTGSDYTFDVTRNLFGVDAYSVAADINAAIAAVGPALPLIAEPYCNPLRYAGGFNIATVGPVTTFAAVNPAAVDFVALGVVAGDFVILRDVTSSVDRSVYAVDVVSTSSLDCSLVWGGVADETNKMAYVSNGKLAIRLRITDHTDSNIGKPDYRLQALNERMSIFIPSDGPVDQDSQRYAATTLGFLPLMEAIARPTPASEVILTYNAQPGAAVDGVARTKASAAFNPSTFSGMGRTNPYDPLQLVAYTYQSRCDVTAGTTVTFNCAGALTAGVQVDYILAIRASSTAGDVNKRLVVTAVDDTSITAVAVDAVTACSGVDIEVGPNFTFASVLDATVLLSGGTSNDGEYVVKQQGAINFELTVDKRIPVPYGIGNLPVACTLSIGRYAMTFESLKEDLTAQIYMATEANPASGFLNFFSTEPQDAYSTTVYFKPPSLPGGLTEGDLLEIYTINLTPTFVATITAIDTTAGVVTLDTALPANMLPITFTKDSPVPFARIRRQHTDNFSVYSAALTSWLEGLNLDQNFMELTRALNALLVNTNPTPPQVNDAMTQLTTLNNTLFGVATILASYDAPVVPQVDSLVRSFYEKGADRAVDILLSCRFTEFFGLEQDGLSYSAYVQSTIKDVQNNDLPIRKFDRLTSNKAKQALLAEWDEQDFEFSKGDADAEVPYDPPGTADVIVSS